MFMKKINKTTRSYYSSLVIKVFSALMGIAVDDYNVIDEILTDLEAKVGKECDLYYKDDKNSFGWVEIDGWLFDTHGRFCGMTEEDCLPFDYEAYRDMIERLNANNGKKKAFEDAMRRSWYEESGQTVMFAHKDDLDDEKVSDEIVGLLVCTSFGYWEFDKDGNLLGEWDEIDQECWEEQSRTDLN